MIAWGYTIITIQHQPDDTTLHQPDRRHTEKSSPTRRRRRHHRHASGRLLQRLRTVASSPGIRLPFSVAIGGTHGKTTEISGEATKMKAILRMILWDIMNQLDMIFGWFWVSANDGFPHKLRAFSWGKSRLQPWDFDDQRHYILHAWDCHITWKHVSGPRDAWYTYIHIITLV